MITISQSQEVRRAAILIFSTVGFPNIMERETALLNIQMNLDHWASPLDENSALDRKMIETLSEKIGNYCESGVPVSATIAKSIALILPTLEKFKVIIKGT